MSHNCNIIGAINEPLSGCLCAVACWSGHADCRNDFTTTERCRYYNIGRNRGCEDTLWCLPVLLVMFGNLFMEVLWRVGDEAELGQIARRMICFIVVPQLSYIHRGWDWHVNATIVCQSTAGRKRSERERKKGTREANITNLCYSISADCL